MSVYIPWRYTPQINTAMLALGGGQNMWVNRAWKGFGRFSAYAVSIFAGQVLARGYWVYKRSFNASREAAQLAYVKHHTTSRYDEKRAIKQKGVNYGSPYLELPAYEEVKVKMAS